MNQMEHLVNEHSSYANYLIGLTIGVLLIFAAMVVWYLVQRHRKRRQRREDRRQQRSRGGRPKR